MSLKKKIIIWVLALGAVQAVISYFTVPSLGGLGSFLKVVNVKIGGYSVGFNINIIIMTYVTMAILIFLVWWLVKEKNEVPSRKQAMAESIVGFFDNVCRESLGDGLGRKYLPLVGTLFIFILLANCMGAIPPFWQWGPLKGHWFRFIEPTIDINTNLGMALIVFFVVHISAVKIKGVKDYVKSYFDPLFFMAPLNIVGELAKVVSHSFRLFGNIMGSAVIVIVISGLLRQVLLPVFLVGFFGIFIGILQAFVFAMLALAYVTVAVK